MKLIINATVQLIISISLWGTLKNRVTSQIIPLQRSFSDQSSNRNGSSIQRQSSFRQDYCSTNYRFDYLQLTLSWPPGSCSTSPQECRKKANRDFNIHGMWPTIKGTLEPSNCCHDGKFNFRALEPILKDLDRYWYSYYDLNSNKGFWIHEWRKHGTCSRNIDSLKGEARYFTTTVQLMKQLKILDTLNKANIKPDDKKSYESSEIAKALEPLSGGRLIQIDCDYELNQPVPFLTGLNFCYDPSLRPIDCPSTKRRCQKQVVFRSTVLRPLNQRQK